VSTKGQKKHNNRLVGRLGLNTTRFYDERKPLNCVLGGSALSIEDGYVSYVGPFDSNILTSMNTEFPKKSQINFSTFSLMLETFNLSRLEEMYNFMVKCLIASSLSVFKGSGVDVSQTCRFAGVYSSKQVTSVDEFVEMLLSTATSNLAGHSLVLSLREIIRRYFDDVSKYRVFFEGFACYFRDVLVNKRCPFLFGLPKFKKTFVVVPTYGSQSSNDIVIILVECFNLKYVYHKVDQQSLYNIFAELWDIIKYIPNSVWKCFKKFDSLFCEILKCLTLHKSLSPDAVLDYFV